MDLGLRDRVFLVTAASSGLGGATARQLVAEGAKVVLVARRQDALAEVVDALGADRAVALTADLADPATAETACRLALDTYSRLDGALVSVGGPAAGTALGTPDSDWLAGFDAVFLAALRVTRAVVAHGTADDLAIAWVLSTSVKAPIGGLAVSNGLRPGLAMLVKQLADELGADGTRVVALLPGRVETDRVKHLDSLSADPACCSDGQRAGHPVASLRSAGGVRHGCGVPALTGGVVRHRQRGGRGRRRDPRPVIGSAP